MRCLQRWNHARFRRGETALCADNPDEQWFAERGFSVVGIEALPVERQVLYNYQRSSKVLIKSL